jgi:acylphosphatase
LMKRVKARVRIEGLVQGVFYRYSTQQKAQELGVNGWVRNLRDGSVECLMEGERDTVNALIRWCHHGPPGARVEKVQTQWEEYTGDVQGFSITY